MANSKYTTEEIKKLVNQAKSGNSDAFGRLYDIYGAKIYRYLYYKVNNKEDTEDLTEEVFLKAWQALRKYKIKKIPFSSWLYKIALNLVIDFYRKKRLA